MNTSQHILGIETSCDETAASVVRFGTGDPDGGTVLSSVVASQDDLHAEYRGVVPEIASRAHAERVLPIVRKAVSDAKLELKNITAIAVGNRPGLIGPLLVGVSAAKALAWSLGVPLVAIDHVHAHLYAGCLDGAIPPFPALGLVVSGGHTSLYRCQSPTKLHRVGSTIDDAVGEAFDKVAAILGIGFPGGAAVDNLARGGDDAALKLPVSRLSRDSLDFTFSGLKTSVLYAVRGVPSDRLGRGGSPPTSATPADIAASFQRAAVEQIVLKLRRAVELHADCRTLLVGGGVSANSRLRAEVTRFAAEHGLELRLPKMAYCVDNAAMLAGLASHRLAERGGVGDDLGTPAVPTTAC